MPGVNPEHDRHIKPLLGKKIVSLTQADIRPFFGGVATGETAAIIKTKLRGKSITKGSWGVAKRTPGLLGGILKPTTSRGSRWKKPPRSHPSTVVKSKWAIEEDGLC